MNHSQVFFSRARQKGVLLQNALPKLSLWLLSWHYSPSETIGTEKSFTERNTKKYTRLRENLCLLSRDSWVGLGAPPLHTQHCFRHREGLQEGPSHSILSRLQVQHWLNAETGSECRAKCWPGLFTDLF